MLFLISGNKQFTVHLQCTWDTPSSPVGEVFKPKSEILQLLQIVPIVRKRKSVVTQNSANAACTSQFEWKYDKLTMQSWATPSLTKGSAMSRVIRVSYIWSSRVPRKHQLSMQLRNTDKAVNKKTFITTAVNTSYSNVQGHIRFPSSILCLARQHSCQTLYCTFPCECEIVCVSVARGQICKFGGYSLWTYWPRRLRWAARPYADGRHRAHPCLCPPPCYRQSATWRHKKRIYRSTLEENAETPISDTTFDAFDAFVRCNEDGSAHVVQLVTVCM